MLLRVRVTPNARRTEILGWCEDQVSGPVLRIRVAAPPREGAANRELRIFLAKALRLPKGRIRLARGAAARIKTFQIPDGTALPTVTAPRTYQAVGVEGNQVARTRLAGRTTCPAEPVLPDGETTLTLGPDAETIRPWAEKLLKRR